MDTVGSMRESIPEPSWKAGPLERTRVFRCKCGVWWDCEAQLRCCMVCGSDTCPECRIACWSCAGTLCPECAIDNGDQMVCVKCEKDGLDEEA